MIRAVGGKGVHRADAVCDDCGRAETVACDYRRSTGNIWSPDEGQVKKKIAAHGWSDVKSKLRCPRCEAKRKIKPMPSEKTVDTNPPQMSKRDRISIISMLAEVYDLDAGRYRANDTDETVAEVLETRPGWVSEVREAEFGPAGGNEVMEALEAEAAEQRTSLAALAASVDNQARDIRAATEAVKALQDQLARIRKAVGPRVAHKAAVR